MAEQSLIRWTDSSWNPMTGCTHVSPGCDHCYAENIAERMRGTPGFPIGFEPMLRPHRLREPRRWKQPRRVFVNSMSDLFHRAFPTEEIDKVFDVMVEVDRHIYQVLTKRPERMEHYVEHYLDRRDLVQLPSHIWLGTSIELDKFCYRADVLRRIDVPIRFVSAEPLLGPLPSLDLYDIAWLIVGGESGNNGTTDYRPMDHAWARDLRDRALAGGTAFFFKQSSGRRTETGIELDGKRWEQYPANRELSDRTQRLLHGIFAHAWKT